MLAKRDRRHIRLRDDPKSVSYTPHSGGRDKPPPYRDRAKHAALLRKALQEAARAVQERRTGAAVQPIEGTDPGTYLEFESPPGVSLNLKSLEVHAGNKRPIEIATVKVHDDGRETAVVFVPADRSDHYDKKVEQYATRVTPKNGVPKHKSLVERIESIAPATLEDLWTDDPAKFPSDRSTKVWWEVWLWRPPVADIQGGPYARFLEFADLMGIRTAERRLQFEDRIVLLAEARPDQLASSLDALSGDIMEVRGASQVAAPFDAMDAPEQVEWITELIQRTSGPDDDATAVCVLDTGVNRGHPLLVNVANPDDMHSFDPEWGTADHDGHGTEMAGLATYGNLADVLGKSDPVVLRHRIESVKILPRKGRNDPDLYGTIMAGAASRVEIQAPDRDRCFSLAVTDDDQADRGQPTSWSAAIDALATGRAFDENEQGFIYTTKADREARRLFVVCAGNVDRLPAANHMDSCDTSVVQDPAQAWNALTVGACTDFAVINNDDPDLADYQPVAAPGGLSPHSCTSVGFQRAKWPLKPDVVFEGGNVAHDGHGNVTAGAPDLTLLSTGHEPTKRPLVITWGTSAATAQVARMAAILQREYPGLWPETIRGLIVHSARWTPRMMEHVGGDNWRNANKRERETHVRRFGFGVPSLERAGRSATDALTLIVERHDLHPFADKGSYGSYADMQVFELPWPEDELEKLGGATVRLRVTLSYFIEPNPARRGRLDRYSYQSHGLRFRLKPGAEQSMEEFVKGLSKAALDEEEKRPEYVPQDGWFLGDHAERRGSILTNVWEGAAAELAHRGVLAVYGVAGWWKGQKQARGFQAPYSLIVSIEAEDQNVDIYTPVANKVGVPVTIDAIEL